MEVFKKPIKDWRSEKDTMRRSKAANVSLQSRQEGRNESQFKEEHKSRRRRRPHRLYVGGWTEGEESEIKSVDKLREAGAIFPRLRRV
jgi:hypothetical protein